MLGKALGQTYWSPAGLGLKRFVIFVKSAARVPFCMRFLGLAWIYIGKRRHACPCLLLWAAPKAQWLNT